MASPAVAPPSTTRSDPRQTAPEDHVRLDFTADAPNTSLVLDALEQAIHDRRPAKGLIQHTDRGVQYLSIRYSERLADIGIKPSVGRVGSSYDNALAETVIGLFKTEVIRRMGRGVISKPSSSRRWTGSTGSIISRYSDRSAISRRPRPKPISITHSSSLPKQHDSSPRASGKTGAIHVYYYR
jgi:putative transposase